MRGSTEVSFPDRVKHWFYGLPLFTRSFLVIVVMLQLGAFITGLDDVTGVCLQPIAAVRRFQVYRLLTAMLFHLGIFHVLFNMMAFVPMGESLERLLGTVQFSYLVVLFGVLEGLIYLALAYVLAVTHLYPAALEQCVAGASGVIFGLIVVENAVGGAGHRSVFGLFSIPAAWYPWALLLLLGLLMPQASFMGHLCGVVVGELYVRRYLLRLQLSRGTILAIENSWLVAHYLLRSPAFMMAPGASLPTSYSPSSPGPPAPQAPPFTALSQLWGLQQQATTPEAGSSGSTGVQDKNFQGSGRTLGGGGALKAAPPRTAAAAAAEARISGTQPHSTSIQDQP